MVITFGIDFVNFFEQLFCIKVLYTALLFCTYSLCLYLFVKKKIDDKAACKMLVKLTKGVDKSTNTKQTMRQLKKLGNCCFFSISYILIN